MVISLRIPPPADTAGAMIVADLTMNGRMDYLVSVPGHVAAHANDGHELWVRRLDICLNAKSETNGLPGHHGSGLQAGDIDGDGQTEVLFFVQDSVLYVLDGVTGQTEWTASPPHPEGSERWEQVMIADFCGNGDRDLLLQTSNKDGYRIGRYLTAYSAEELRKANYQPLWQRDDFFSCAHNGARLADLDGDGRDEVLGGTVLSSTGRPLVSVPLDPLLRRPHLDSIFVADVDPEREGLEVVALEEGGENRVFCYGYGGLVFVTHYQNWEPQNAAIGRFDPARPGLQIWCRSRFNEHQKPFVFDQRGELISRYDMDAVAPVGWTVRGVEVINAIHWTGEARQYAVAKERHRSGDVALFDPIQGQFLERFEEQADRLYVADVSGDWREEIIVLAQRELHVYHNDSPNPNPDRPRLWSQQSYRRSKMTWNYYSP